MRNAIVRACSVTTWNDTDSAGIGPRSGRPGNRRPASSCTVASVGASRSVSQTESTPCRIAASRSSPSPVSMLLPGRSPTIG
jgi:hypothetical protein